MINFGYHLARREAAAVRRSYRALLPALPPSPVRQTAPLAFEVFAYSNQENLPEQVASIRSFLKNAGAPRRFTVVSDGSHTRASVELLERIHPAVRVCQLAEIVRPDLPRDLHPYLSGHPTGKQLALIMSLPLDGPALYVDSDVLFFRDAHCLEALAAGRETPAFFLTDCQVSGDPRLFLPGDPMAPPVNTGVLLLFQPLDWSLSIARCRKPRG